jgi:hypothetical protein
MKLIVNWLIKLGILKKDLDYYVIRISLILIFLFFGYQKWLAGRCPRSDCRLLHQTRYEPTFR